MVSQFFMDFARKCLEGELRTCELRLSDEEKEYISKSYSAIKLRPLEGVDNSDGKSWYEVTAE